jgi:glucosylceramidase
MSRLAILICSILIFAINLAGQTVSVYQTTQDLSQKLEAKPALTFGASGTGTRTITIDDARTYQRISGFGASFTDSSAWLIYTKLTEAQRNSIMEQMFSRTNGIGLNWIRQPMGASDLALDFYSYDDMPAGQSDPTLANFSIDHDRAYIIPVLKQAMSYNPSIVFMANPWSPPAWMKTNNSLLGVSNGTSGHLKQDAYGPLANYFVKYIQAYAAEGIWTHYISLQNEPLYAPPGYTGMLMSTDDQVKLLNDYITPAFNEAGISAGVLIYDHNWDRADFPRTLLANATTRQNIAGVAWHHYGGDPSAMTAVHDLYPEFDHFETEASGGTWQSGNILAQEAKELINSMRNWAKSYVLWNYALDQDHGPYATTDNGQHGCDTCRGIVTVNWDKSGSGAPSTVTPELDFYVLGHASKFVQPLAYRIFSDQDVTAGLYDVAFRNRDGSVVVYVLNDGSADATFNLKYKGKFVTATVARGAIATFTWPAETVPEITMYEDPNGITIAAGNTGHVALGIRPVSGTPTVALTCAVTDLAGNTTTKATCSVTPPNHTFTDDSPLLGDLTITAAGTATTSNQQGSSAFKWMMSISAVGLFGSVVGARGNKRLAIAMMLIVLSLTAAMMISCGGGGGGGGTNPPPPPPPPPPVQTSATYIATVTATTNAGSPVSLSVHVLVKP